MSDPRKTTESSPRGRPAPEDRIEELLRATGARPVVPSDRMERSRSIVRAHWRVEVGRSSRRRWLWTAVAASAAILLLSVAIGLLQSPGLAPTGAAVGQVEKVVRSAWSRPAEPTTTGAATALAPGDAVTVGSEIATEPSGRLSLRMTSAHSLRLDGGARIRVLEARTITLDRGAVYVDSRGPWGSSEEPLEIRTPYGRIHDVGTQFEVRLATDFMHVRVREGSVTLEGAMETVEVAAGRGLRVDPDGRFEPLESSAVGDEWAWIAELTPMMEIEGRSLREFLDWIARERGLQLQFTNGDLNAVASGITLNGSIEGMTLDQALESVLPTCRMTHRLNRDVLLVGPLAETP